MAKPAERAAIIGFIMNVTQEQQTAIRAIARNQAVLAGAGTGKTFVLVQRFLHALETRPDWELNSVVAITFTKAAAMSMRQRIRREIEAKAGNGSDLWQCRLAELDALQVTTVHSYCQRLLAEHALEAGIDADFAVADESEATSLHQEAIRRYCLELENSSSAELELVGIFQLKEFKRVLENLLDQEHLLRRLGAAESVNAYLQRVWETTHAEVEEAVTAEIDQQNLRQTWSTLIEALDDPLCSSALADRCSWALEIIPYLLESNWHQARVVFGQETPPSKRAVGNKKMFPQLKQQSNDAWRSVLDICRMLEEVRAGSVGEEPDQQDRESLRLLALWHAAWQRTNHHFEEIKQEQNLLTFNDLELKALWLLRDHTTNPASRLPSAILGIKHLLVDEYQDINPLQQEIIGCLADLTGNVVREGDRDGRLFAVGDTKQSIYRFRGAEVSEFVELAEELGGHAGSEPIRLSESFRANRDLTAATNKVFQQVFQS